MTPEGHTACHGTFIFADPRQMSHACHRFWTCYKTLTFYHVLLTFDKVHNPLRNHIWTSKNPEAAQWHSTCEPSIPHSCWIEGSQASSLSSPIPAGAVQSAGRTWGQPAMQTPSWTWSQRACRPLRMRLLSSQRWANSTAPRTEPSSWTVARARPVFLLNLAYQAGPKSESGR